MQTSHTARAASGPRSPSGRPIPPTSVERYFPEWAHRKALAGGVADYDYQSCRAIDPARARGLAEVRFSELGALGAHLNREMHGTSCDPDDCYLRVSTYGLESTVTLDASATVRCEDRVSGSIPCPLSSAAVPTASHQRGTVVLADKIRITDTLEIGSMSLILIASKSIEFVGSGAIVAFSAPAAAGTDVHPNPSGIVPNCMELDGTIQCEQVPLYAGGGDGEEGQNAGSVVLIAPMIKTGGSAGGRAHVDVSGQDGGRGGDHLSDIRCGFYEECEQINDGGPMGGRLCSNNYSRPHAQCFSAAWQAPSPGSGGAGGDAGKVITFAMRSDGYGLDTKDGNGFAGRAGRAAIVTNYDGTAPNGHVPYAAPTEDGKAGWRDDVILDSYRDYAFGFARRGADRLLYNAEHFARHVHGPSAPPHAVAVASGSLRGFLHEFCRPTEPTSEAQDYESWPAEFECDPCFPDPETEDLPQAFPDDDFDVGLPWEEVRSEEAPEKYLTDLVTEQRLAMCAEAEQRLVRVESGLNWHGLDEDFVMYLRPDTVAELRGSALDEVDQLAGLFEDDAWLAAQAATDLETLLLDARPEREAEVQVAEARVRHLGQVVVETLAQIERVHEQIEDIGSRTEETQSKLEGQLELASCNFFCAFGRFVSFVGSIASAVYNIGSAVGTLVNFVSNLSAIFDIGDVVNKIKAGAGQNWDLGPINQVKVLSEYAKVALAGTTISGEKVDGLDAVGKKVAAGYKAWKSTPNLSGPNPVATAWREVAFNVGTLQSDIRESMQSVITGITTVEALPQGQVVDRNGALAGLRFILQLLEQRLALVNRLDELSKEHLMAAGELQLAVMEHDLAEANLVRLDERIRRGRCRLGVAAPGECEGIPVVQSLEARRDALCEAGKGMNDVALLLDFYYQRSKRFATLVSGAISIHDRSDDFGRNLFDATDRASFNSVSANPLVDDFLAQITTSNTGVLNSQMCRPGEDCGLGVVATTREYPVEVLSQLLDFGRTRFDLDEECPGGTGGAFCPPAVYSNQRARRRVTSFDVELAVAPGYRLGCLGASCEAPASGIADQPLDGFTYKVRYRHSDEARFFWDQNGTAQLTDETFYFPETYPRQACETFNVRNGGATDCRTVIDFGGTVTHASPSQHTLDPGPAWTATDYADPTIFGTSIRGEWEIDITETLVQLNGEGGDQCYRIHPDYPEGASLEDRCLPRQCLSPCFDDEGQRISAANGAPDFCACYDANGAFLASAQGLEVCQDRPATLTWVRNDIELPELCLPPAAGPTQPRLLESMCARFASDTGDFYPNGSPVCCNPDGRLKGNLDAAQRASCREAGFTSDTMCVAPSECMLICGPRCKAFKAALLGFQYRIDWQESH